MDSSSQKTEITGVYSNSQIKQAIETGHVVLYPYNEQHINGSSVDVTLGEWYYRTERNTQRSVYNPFDEHDVSKHFEGPYQATPHRQWVQKHGMTQFVNVPQEHPIIVLGPGERILAHTHEFVGIKAPGTSTMQSRSTWGRNGVAVCLDAGWGDPGYINRWTMEIYNMNQHHSIVLPVGERIAQLVFYHTGEVEGEYHDLSGKYQTESENDLAGIIRSWRPEQMLPRAFKDERNLPKGLQQ